MGERVSPARFQGSWASEGGGEAAGGAEPPNEPPMIRAINEVGFSPLLYLIP
jgi:hypothetical protein